MKPSNIEMRRSRIKDYHSIAIRWLVYPHCKFQPDTLIELLRLMSHELPCNATFAIDTFFDSLSHDDKEQKLIAFHTIIGLLNDFHFGSKASYGCFFVYLGLSELLSPDKPNSSSALLHFLNAWFVGNNTEHAFLKLTNLVAKSQQIDHSLPRTHLAIICDDCI